MIDLIDIKLLRMNLKKTQSEVASELGLRTSMWSAVEKDLRQPSLETAIGMSRILKVTVGQLVGEEPFNLADWIRDNV